MLERKIECENCGETYPPGWPHECESSASSTCSIAVPVRELEKLEQARGQLYEFLADKLTERDMLGLTDITGQIWRVANTKNWDRQ